MAEKRFVGWRALVTGASSGIGADIARRLGEEGATLVITARRRERLDQLAEEIRAKSSVEVQVLPCDLADPEGPATLVQETEGAGVDIDILINNAGFGDYRPFTAIAWERHAAMLQLNMVSLTQLTHRLVPKMIERGRGHIMNIASIAAYSPVPNFAVYGGTKAYVRNFTESLDYELKGTGVRAIAISPGGTRTEFPDSANQKLNKTGQKTLMTSERCAHIAVDKMLKGRRSVVTGVINAIFTWLYRFIPRAWLPGLVHFTLRQGVESAQIESNEDQTKQLESQKAVGEMSQEEIEPGTSEEKE